MSIMLSPLPLRPQESFQWGRILLAACGAFGVVVMVSLTITSQANSSNLMASTALRTSTVVPLVRQSGAIAQDKVLSSRSVRAAQVALSASQASEPVVTLPSAEPSTKMVGLVATISTVFGAVVMKLWNSRNQPAPVAMSSITGAPSMGFENAGLMQWPEVSTDRGSRVTLHAAKAGKGGKGGAGGGGGGKGKIAGIIKLALPAGKATPAPPVGPALGQYGLNIVAFCKDYNAQTEKDAAEGMIIPVEITAFEDRTFTFVLKTPPASVLLRKAAKIEKGSANPKKEIVGTITLAQLEQIARTKLPDLNTTDVGQAMKTIEGTAKNMGVAIQR